MQPPNPQQPSFTNPNQYAPPVIQPPPVAQAPVTPQPQYGQPLPSAGYPTQPTGIASAQPQSSPFDSPSVGKPGRKMIIGAIIGGIVVLAGGGFGGYYLGKDAGVAEATGGTPDGDYAGKWFSASCYTYSYDGEVNCSYNGVWLKEDGAIAFWDSPYFECSDGMHVRGYYVNNDGNDCIDGTDEGTTKANNFNSDSVWLNRNGMKLADYDANSYSDYYYLSMTWGINDDDQLCFSYRMYNDDNFHTGMTSCQEVWLSHEAIWHKYELFDDDSWHAGNDDTDCDLMVRMDRASGPPEDDNQAWTDLMNLEISEAMGGKPSACSGTTYQELTEGFAVEDEY